MLYPRLSRRNGHFPPVPMQGDGSTTRCLRWPLPAITANPALPSALGAISTPWPSAMPGLPCRHSTALRRTPVPVRSSHRSGPAGHQHRLPVLADGGGPIDVPPGAEVSLGCGWHRHGQTAGQPPTQVGRIGCTPGADTPLRRGDDGLFRNATGEPLAPDPARAWCPGGAGRLQRQPRQPWSA